MTQSEALTILKTGANVFLTGEPGSGKTHTINQYVDYLREHHIDPAITASTGIAATHIGGMTIHSWSGIGIKTNLNKYDLDQIASSEHINKRIRRTHVLIIDEVSMLSADTLSMVEAVCREVRQNSMAFGGLQVIFVGDFFQLPPIVKNDQSGVGKFGSKAGGKDGGKFGINNFSKKSEMSEIDYETGQTKLMEMPADTARFACDSSAWQRAKPIVCYLTEQYRQDDDVFLSVLTSIRTNTFEEEHFFHIEKRKIERTEIPENVPKLFSHNVHVDKVNDDTLEKINSEKRFFNMTSRGPIPLVNALIKGCLSPEKLVLKIGAAVMFTKNNQREGYINGTLGIVTGFSKTSGYPTVKITGAGVDKKTDNSFDNKNVSVEVSPLEWAIEENGVIKASITQLPLRLAWAITVHKSQGMSMDSAVMDLSKVFEYGQGYVALSRVRRLSGLHLLGWNQKAFQVHPEILEKDETFRSLSEQANAEFKKIPKKELTKMHKNFIAACGGKN